MENNIMGMSVNRYKAIRAMEILGFQADCEVDENCEANPEDSEAWYEMENKITDAFGVIDSTALEQQLQASQGCEPDKGYPEDMQMQFEGDIIITDPCYIIRDECWEQGIYDTERTEEMQHSISRDTIYGDWSCTTYDRDTGEEIGRFCADAGRVCVVLLEDALKHNPEFKDHMEKPWTTTWIKDFDGLVGIKEIVDEENHDKWVEIVGVGNVNFITKQTGF